MRIVKIDFRKIKNRMHGFGLSSHGGEHMHQYWKLTERDDITCAYYPDSMKLFIDPVMSQEELDDPKWCIRIPESELHNYMSNEEIKPVNSRKLQQSITDMRQLCSRL